MDGHDQPITDTKEVKSCFSAKNLLSLTWKIRQNWKLLNLIYVFVPAAVSGRLLPVGQFPISELPLCVS